MSYYAVFDTNVLVSSILSKDKGSSTVLVVDQIAHGTIIPIYNDEIIEEYEDVLRRDKFAFSEENIDRLLESIKKRGLSVVPQATGVKLQDMDDLVFYEVTMEKRKDNAYLITGNVKHFPKEPFIVTPSEMMDIINN